MLAMKCSTFVPNKWDRMCANCRKSESSHQHKIVEELAEQRKKRVEEERIQEQLLLDKIEQQRRSIEEAKAEEERLKELERERVQALTFQTTSGLCVCFNDTSLPVHKLPTDICREIMTRLWLSDFRCLLCVNKSLNTNLSNFINFSQLPPEVVIREGLTETGEETILQVRDREGGYDYYYSYGFEYTTTFTPITEPHVLVLEAFRKGCFAPVIRHEFSYSAKDKKYALITPEPTYSSPRKKRLGEWLSYISWAGTRSLNFNLATLSHPTTPQLCQVVLSTRNETCPLRRNAKIQEVTIQAQNAPRRTDALPPCFSCGCKVKMADQTFKDVSEIKPGDRVSSNTEGKSNRILEVVVTRWNKEKVMVDISGMKVTRGHPILVDDEWYRPDEIFRTEQLAFVENLYNFILDDEHLVIIGSEGKETVCSTLGRFCGERLAALYPNHLSLFGPEFLSRVQNSASLN